MHWVTSTITSVIFSSDLMLEKISCEHWRQCPFCCRRNNDAAAAAGRRGRLRVGPSDTNTADAVVGRNVGKLVSRPTRRSGGSADVDDNKGIGFLNEGH